MEKLAGRLVVVMVLIIAALGVYVFNLRENLSKADETVAMATQNRDEFRHKLDAMTKSANANIAAVNTCNAQLKDTQAQLEAANAKHPAGKKH